MLNVLMFLPTILIGVVVVSIVGGVFYFINNNSIKMDPNQAKAGVLNFFLNLGAIVALGFVIGNLISLLFTIIDKAYPTITGGYPYYGGYYGGSSISFSVASLIVVFPLYVLFMWLLERSYKVDPERRNNWFKRFLNYVVLFVTGLSFVGDLITVIYYFIDGRDMTAGFLMKALSILVIALAVFYYYISDLLNRLDSRSRKVWTITSAIVILLAIVWGFSVLGSPRSQRLYRYDEQKVADLMNIDSQVINYYQNHAGLPATISELNSNNNYYVMPNDPQSGKPYEYVLVGQSAKAYQLCAEFNKSSEELKGKGGSYPYPYSSPYPHNGTVWDHPAGRHCFPRTIDTLMYPPVKILPM